MLLSEFGSKIRRDGYEFQVAKRWAVLALFCVNVVKVYFPEWPSLYDIKVG